MSSDKITLDKTVDACLVIIGNEILSGRTQDANLAYIAKGLGEVGVRLKEVRVIPDVAETIIATINELRAKFAYVFTTGGIGPTHDDITSESLARAFGVPWVLDPEAKRRLEAGYRPGELNAARLRMAHVPEGARLIDNPVSRAPGFQIDNVLVMAGVPKVMQAMFDGIKHRRFRRRADEPHSRARRRACRGRPAGVSLLHPRDPSPIVPPSTLWFPAPMAELVD